MGDLYIAHMCADVWDDVTLRTRRTLGDAALIVVPGADSPMAVLIRSDVAVPMLDLDRETTASATHAIRTALERGDVVWVVPGAAAWSEDREAVLRSLAVSGIAVLSLPGACDPITAIVLSGLPADRFSYLGMIPIAQHARRRALARLAHEEYTLVYTVQDAPPAEVLSDVADVMGDRRVAVLSAHGMWRGRASDFVGGAGEGQLVIEGRGEAQTWTEEQVRDRVCQCLARGESAGDASRAVARDSGWKRRAVYRIVLELTARRDE